MANVESESAGNEEPSALVRLLVARLASRDAELASRDADLASRDAELVERDVKIEELTSVHARLLNAYEALKEELLLVKRRMFIAKAERVDTASLQLEFDALVKKLDALAGVLPEPSDDAGDGGEDDGDTGGGGKKPKKRKPKGRRNLADADMPEVVVEVDDELFEQLVAEGKAERIGSETSYKLVWERGGFRRLRIERVKYRAANAQGTAEIETAPVPPELLPRCLAAPSTLAHIATSKFCDGLPLYRQEDILSRSGASIDRGTMSRWLEELGGTFGATVIAAARKDAFANAFCMMTDATGFSVQPGSREGGPRRPCRKGHYFVQIADRDHIFFEFTERQTTETVRALFKGFDGYIQADACSVYNALFRPAAPDDPDDDGCTRTEVGCWAHARRKYWEAALAKQTVAREALVRIGKIFELDASFRKKGRPPPSKIKRLRKRHLAPLVEEFLNFAEHEYDKVKDERGSLRSALGYSVRQAGALRAFLEEGRLRLDNNLSEGQLRKVVRIRDASLFAGSNQHASSAGHILSLIASARLHHLDPERYLRDLIRILPFWPRERFLELAPKYWAATRARIDDDELAREVGVIRVPERIDARSPE